MRLAAALVAAIVAAAAGGCGGRGARDAGPKPAWCPRLPLSTDRTGDLTGKENTAKRVLAVKHDIQVEALGCGAGWLGVGYAPIMAAVVDGRELPAGPGLVSPDDLSHTLIIYLLGNAPSPVANPLYVDGVRVYFIGGDVDKPIPPSTTVPPPPAPPDRPSRGAWCAEVALTADPAEDATGKSNTKAKVSVILGRISRSVHKCAGLQSFGIVPSRVARAMLEGKPPPLDAFDEEGSDYAIQITIEPEAPKPIANPLFIDGVPVYFQYTHIGPL